MKQVYFIVPFFVSASCCCQEITPLAKFDYTGNEFSAKMNAHVRKHRNTLSGYIGICFARNEAFSQAMGTACEVGVALIKFKVKESGLADVACTKSTHLGLAAMFKEAVKRSSRYWKAAGNKELYYVLPIHYNFRSGCDDSVKGRNLDKESDFIFEFDDGIKIEETQCVILMSYKFKSGVKDDFGPPLPSKK